MHRVVSAERITIGKPIANTQCYILDDNGGPVPIGVTGELYIGGDGVARGYHNRDDLTRERFVDDPFHRCDGRKMYRTVIWLDLIGTERCIFSGAWITK